MKKNLLQHALGFSPYAGFMAFLYLNLLVGAVIGICAVAIIAHRPLHDFFHSETVWNFIVWSRYFN